MTEKKLTWEESWGKVDWEKITIKEINDLIDRGADLLATTRDSDGKLLFPLDFVRNREDRLYYNMAKRMQKTGQDQEYRYLKEKDKYNEKKELKKENWKDLNWCFASKKVIQEMAKKGLDVNGFVSVEYEMDSYFRPIRVGSTKPLFCAALAGNIEAVKALIELGADPNLTDSHTYYPQRGKMTSEESVIYRLLENCPQTSYPRRKSATFEIATYLVKHGAKATSEQLRTIKQLNTNRLGLLKRLDSLNKQPPTAIRKAAKEAAVKEYRKQNPKSSGR